MCVCSIPIRPPYHPHQGTNMRTQLASLFLVIITLSCVLGLQSGDKEDDDVDPRAKLSETLDALEKGLQFMQERFESINLDGVIGTRLVEGGLIIRFHDWILFSFY